MMRKTKHTAPGKSNRKGISIFQLEKMFPNEAAAVRWFESIYWPDERCCGHCGSTRTREASHKKMPYWCSDCRKYFSVRTGTSMQNSRLPLRKWAYAVYLYVTNLKGISSMRLSREIDVTQKTAWFMLHRLRDSWDASGLDALLGPVEADETYMGGKRKNMSNAKRKTLTGRGSVGKTAVAGIKDRESNQVSARVVANVKSETMSRFIMEHIAPGAKIYTDDALVYHQLPNHESVRHGVNEYVRGQAHTNGVESFWSMLKRGYVGIFHKMSPKHLQRYVGEFAKRHNVREWDTLEQMQAVVAGLVGKRLMYRELIADNGLDSGAREIA
ncbi:MAG: IS1595 family transposase [Caldilineaceae bacterium]|nr:IS1595 family transposase [Caldilineaceae bacterium]